MNRSAVRIILLASLATAMTTRAAQAEVVLDHIELVDNLFGAKGSRSAMYHIINRGLDAVHVTVACDLVSATGEVLMSAPGKVLDPSPDGAVAALTVGFGGASFLDDGAKSLLATMQITNVRCNVTTEAVKQPPQSVGPARIGDRGPTHGSPVAPHGLRGALACPSPPVLRNLVNIEKQYLNEEFERRRDHSEAAQQPLRGRDLALAIQKAAALADVAGWYAEEAMVRWALDHGCQALSNGTRLDVRGALLWERLEFLLCVGSPCLWVRRDDVEGDFHETMSRGTAPGGSSGGWQPDRPKPLNPDAQVDPSWQNSLRQQLQGAKRYPVEAQTRKEEGVVLLKFSLDRNGHVLAHSIAESSGYADLDNEAMGLIMRADPLPPFPANMTQAQIDLTVPIRFSLSSTHTASADDRTPEQIAAERQYCNANPAIGGCAQIIADKNAPTETLKLIRQGYVIARLPWNWDEQVKPGSWLMEAYLMYAMLYRCSEAHVRYLTSMQIAADLISPRQQLPLDGAGRVVLNFDASVIRRSFEALTAIKAAALKQDPTLNIDNMRVEANKLHVDNFEKCLWEAQLLTKMEHELATKN